MKTIIKSLTSFGIPNVISLLTLIANIVLSIINQKRSFNFQKRLEKQKQEFNEKIERFKSENAHNIQIQEYFKKLGTEKQSQILSDWANFVTDLSAFQNTFEDIQKFKSMKHNIVMYGSETTVKILASFIHYTYENDMTTDPYKGGGVCHICNFKFKIRLFWLFNWSGRLFKATNERFFRTQR